MVLVDTSVWVDFLRSGDDTLARLLTRGQVCMHPMIIGELACGNLKNRHQLIGLLRDLPAAVEASHEEAMFLLDSRHLAGKGIGFIDLHLLASTQLSGDTWIWTRDKRLASVAVSLNTAFFDN